MVSINNFRTYFLFVHIKNLEVSDTYFGSAYSKGFKKDEVSDMKRPGKYNPDGILIHPLISLSLKIS